MPATQTLKDLSLEASLDLLAQGAAFVDLRPIDDYLDVHIPGSIALLYEAGPGMAVRARDCLPLDLPLVILDPGDVDVIHAAASLRGKGFTVAGCLRDGINAWAARARPVSTETVTSKPDATILHVGDPGAAPIDGAINLPLERLWHRAHELAGEERVAVAAGYGVRAALAVGILERAGVGDILFWWTSPRISG